MNTLDFLNIFMFIIGLYVLYMTARMVRSGKIDPLFLAVEEQNKVKDASGFIKKVRKPFYLFSIVMAAIGACGLIASHLLGLKWFRFIELAVFLLCWMYFMKTYQDARAEYID